MSRSGVLLFAHGARDPRWAEPFEAVATRVRAGDPARVVQLAFLDSMAPTLRDGAERLVEAGCTEVDVVPLFLGAGGHVRKDLPLLFAGIRAAHPMVRFRLHRAIGEVDSVVAAMADAVLAAKADASATPEAGPR